MRDNKTWCIAKILEVRAKQLDEEDDSLEFENNRGHHRDLTQANGASREYEYYITYLEHERRNDRWVPEVCLRIKDDDWVETELEKIDMDKKKKEDADKQ